MLYEIVKTVHIAGWVMWIGGLILLLQMLANGAVVTDPMTRAARAVTGAGLGLAWLGGLALAIWGGWYLDGWFLAKLVLVFVLSGAHGAILARVGRGEAIPARLLLWVHVAALAVIALLALTKPF